MSQDRNSRQLQQQQQQQQQHQGLLYSQDGEYADTYLEELNQDCTATQTETDSEWKYDNCGCGMNIPWHMITYKMKQHEQPECPPSCPAAKPPDTPSMTRLKELTVCPIGHDQFVDITQEVLNDQLAADDLSIGEIEKQVIKEAGLERPAAPLQEVDSAAVYRPKPKAEQVYDPSEERHNEPYMDKMFTCFPGFFEDPAQCSSRIEMPWTNILLPKNCSIRKTYKPPPPPPKEPTIGREKKRQPLKRDDAKAKRRTKTLARPTKIVPSKEGIAITSTLSNLLMQGPKPLAINSFSQSFLMRPKSKPIEMSNSISHESNLMSVYNFAASTKDGKNRKSKKPHACVPVAKTSKQSLSKGSISKGSITKSSKIRSKTDRIASLLDSCKREMEPIKEGINKLRARIRELNLPTDFRDAKPYYMSQSYGGAMMGTELSFTYSQAMPLHCFPCPPYYHAPYYQPLPTNGGGSGGGSGTKRLKQRNKMTRPSSATTDSDATPYSDADEDSCSCLGPKTGGKGTQKTKDSCEDCWDFQMPKRAQERKAPTGSQQAAEKCVCGKRKSNYRSCGYTQDFLKSAIAVDPPGRTENLCCKCKEPINDDRERGNDWLCQCDRRKNGDGRIKLFDQVGCFCPTKTALGGDPPICNCPTDVARGAQDEDADAVCKACNRKLAANSADQSKVAFGAVCVCGSETPKYKAEKDDPKGTCGCSRQYRYESKLEQGVGKNGESVVDFESTLSLDTCSSGNNGKSKVCNCSRNNKGHESSKTCGCAKGQKNVDESTIEFVKCVNSQLSKIQSKCREALDMSCGCSSKGKSDAKSLISLDPSLKSGCSRATNKSGQNQSQRTLDASVGDSRKRCACSKAAAANRSAIDDLSIAKSANSMDPSQRSAPCACRVFREQSNLPPNQSPRTIDASMGNLRNACACSSNGNRSAIDDLTIAKSANSMNPGQRSAPGIATCRCNELRAESVSEQTRSQRTLDASMGKVCECAENRSAVDDLTATKSVNSMQPSQRSVPGSASCASKVFRGQSNLEQTQSQRTMDASMGRSRRGGCECAKQNQRSAIDDLAAAKPANSMKQSRRSVPGNGGCGCKSLESSLQPAGSQRTVCGCAKDQQGEFDELAKSVNSLSRSVNGSAAANPSQINASAGNLGGQRCVCGQNRSRRTINESMVDFVSSQLAQDPSKRTVDGDDRSQVSRGGCNCRLAGQRSADPSLASQSYQSQRTAAEGCWCGNRGSSPPRCHCGNRNASGADRSQARVNEESTISFAKSITSQLSKSQKSADGQSVPCPCLGDRSQANQMDFAEEQSQRTVNVCSCGLRPSSSQRTVDASAVSFAAQSSVKSACVCSLDQNNFEGNNRGQRTIDGCQCSNRSRIDDFSRSVASSAQMSKSQRSFAEEADCVYNAVPSQIYTQSRETIEQSTGFEAPCNCARRTNQSQITAGGFSQASASQSQITAGGFSQASANQSQRTVDMSPGGASQRTADGVDCKCALAQRNVNNQSIIAGDASRGTFAGCTCQSRMAQDQVCVCSNQNRSQRTIEESAMSFGDASVNQSGTQRTDCDCSGSVGQGRSQRVYESTVSFADSCISESQDERSQKTLEDPCLCNKTTKRNDSCTCSSSSSSSNRESKMSQSRGPRSADGSCNWSMNSEQTVKSQSKMSQNRSQKSADGSCNCSLISEQTVKSQSKVSQRSADGSCNWPGEDTSRNQSKVSQQKSCNCSAGSDRTKSVTSAKSQSRREAAESCSKVSREPSAAEDNKETDKKKKCRCCAAKSGDGDEAKKCQCSAADEVKRKCSCSSKSPTRSEISKKSNYSQTSTAAKSRTDQSIIRDDMKCSCKRIKDAKDPKKVKCACATGAEPSKAPVAKSSSQGRVPEDAESLPDREFSDKVTDGGSKNLSGQVSKASDGTVGAGAGSSRLEASASKNVSRQASEPAKASEQDLGVVKGKSGSKNVSRQASVAVEATSEQDLVEVAKSKSGSRNVSRQISDVAKATAETVGSKTASKNASRQEVDGSGAALVEASAASKDVSRQASEATEAASPKVSKNKATPSREFSKQLDESLRKVKSGNTASSKQRFVYKARIPIPTRRGTESSCTCAESDDELQVYHSPKEFGGKATAPCKVKQSKAVYNSRRSRSCICETPGDESSSSSCDYVARVKPKSRARSCESSDIKPLKPKRICQKVSADSRDSRPKSCECDSKESSRGRTHETSSSFDVSRKSGSECGCDETKRNFNDANDCDANAFGRDRKSEEDCDCPGSDASDEKRIVDKSSKMPELCRKGSDDGLLINQSYIIKGEKVATRTVASWVRPCTKVIRKSFEDVACSPCVVPSASSKVNFKGIVITSKLQLVGSTPPAPPSSLANTVEEVQSCLGEGGFEEDKSAAPVAAIAPMPVHQVLEDAVVKGEVAEVKVAADESRTLQVVSTNTSFVTQRKIYKESKETNTDEDICCCKKAVSSNFARFKLKDEF